MSIRRFLCVVLLVLAFSCAAKTSVPVAVPGAAATGRNPALSSEPWIDYHPQRITVIYADAIDAAALSTVHPAMPDSAAAAMPNACLRTRPEYEPLTDAIAGRFGLQITNQVYTGRTNMAAFELPEQTGGDAVIQGIRAEFGAYATDVYYSRLGRLCYVPDDPLLAESTATSGPQWQIRRMNIPAAWDHTMGSADIMVAVLDSGVRITHEELAATVIDPEVEFPEITADVYHHIKTMADAFGHGTAVASLIAAQGDNGRTMTGVAPGCRLLPIRIAEDNGFFTDATMVEGAYLARDVDADILSMSIYFVSDHPIMRTAMQDLYNSGMLLIASAGNSDSMHGHYPAAYPEVMSIGASLYDDERVDLSTWGSNYGPDVELAAPGVCMVSCTQVIDSGPFAYNRFDGTSAATPLVAGCAALVWSIFPELSADQVRQALSATGAPVTGFNTAMTRPDMEQLLLACQQNSFRPAPLEQAVFASSAQVRLDVTGELGSARATQLSTGYSTLLTAPPWEYEFDLGGLSFGMETITFETDLALGDSVQTIRIPVDNTAGRFPFSEDLDGTAPLVAEVDGRLLDNRLQTELYILDDAYPSPASLRGESSSAWRVLPNAGTDGSACLYFGDAAGEAYGAYELHMAVLPLIDLAGVYDGMLQFTHRYNIQGVMHGNYGDAAAVMVRPESTGVWEIAAHVTHTEAEYRGYQPGWVEDMILLTDYAGQRVRIGFLFNSDMDTAGKEPGMPPGWWIDDIRVTAGAPLIGYAAFADIPIAPYTTVGSVPGDLDITLTMTGTTNVNTATFALDTAPLGETNAADITVSTGLTPFRAHFDIAPDLPNQLAWLIVKGTNLLGEPGKVQTIPLFIYNKAGDANGDGLVNAADTALIHDGLWQAEGDAGYTPFMDTDGDGIITEADASAIGYLWEE